MDIINEEHRKILGWVVTIGIGVVMVALNLLIVYGIHCIYRIMKNFSKKY